MALRHAAKFEINMRVSLPIFCVLLFLAGGVGPTHALPRPAGSPVPHGFSIDSTAEGIGFLTDIVGGVLPPSIPIPTVSGSTCCLEPIPGTCLDTINYDILGLQADLDLASMTIVPDVGSLRVDLSIDVTVNNSATPFSFSTNSSAGLCALAVGDCSAMWIDTFRVDATMFIEVNVDDSDGPGGAIPVINVNVPPPSHNLGELNLGANIQSNLCQVDLILDLLNLLGIGVNDLLLGPVVDYVEQDLPTQVEQVVQSLFDLAILEDSVTTLGAVISYGIYPDEVSITPGGLRVSFEGRLSSPTEAQCIGGIDDDGFESTSNPPPAIAAPAPSGAPYHMAAILDDDLINSAAHAAWRSGLLCLNLNDLLAQLGGAQADQLAGLLTTGLLNLGEETTEALGRVRLGEDSNGGPLHVSMQIRKPPQVRFDGTSDAVLDVENLDLSFYTPLLGRFAHLFTARVNGAIGLDLSFTQYGELSFTPSIDLSDPRTSVTVNDVLPEMTGTIEATLGPWLEGIIEQVVGDFLGAQRVGPLLLALPSVSGNVVLGITDSETNPIGSGDRLGMFGLVEQNPPTNPAGPAASCIDLESCIGYDCTDPTSVQCNQGASNSPNAWSAALPLQLLPVFVMAWARRRRKARN